MVTPRYFPFTGGVESHVYEVARRLVQSGAQVTVLTADPGGRLAAHETQGQIHIWRVRAWPARRDYYFAPGLYQVIQQGDWDLIHIQSYHTLVPPLAMLAARRFKIPYVVTFHGGGHSSRFRNAARRWQRALLRPLLARARKLIAVARFEIEFYGHELGIPGDRFALIPNGSDLPQVTPRPSPGDDLRIASIGRLERYKGHQRILAALPQILEQQPNVRLWIAGSGPYETELRRLAMQLRVTDYLQIRAIPAPDRAAMAAELSKAALVTLLSEYETHPIAAMEALALGVPVLVADTPGLRELAEQGLARSIPLASSATQVAEAVLENLRHPPLRKAVRLPTWDDCAASLLALYQSVLGELPCGS